MSNYVSIMPIMKSNEQDGFTVSASSEYDPQFKAYKAFDGKLSVSNGEYWSSASTGGKDQWLKVEFPSAKRVRKFGIYYTSTSASAGLPQHFELRGINDDESYDKIFIKRGFSPQVPTSQWIDWELDNKKQYKSYVLYCLTPPIQNNSYFYVPEMRLFEDLDYMDVFYLCKSGKSYYSSTKVDSEGKFIPIEELEGREVLSQTDFSSYGFESKDDILKIGEQIKKISICSNINNVIKLTAHTSNDTLITGANDIITKIADKTHYFSITEGENSDTVKVAFSIDEGKTWLTRDKSLRIVDLGITIPQKNYSEMTLEEKEQWTNAKNKIIDNGIPAEEIKAFDFNTFNMDTIRFAYVLKRESKEKNASVKELVWNFDVKGRLEKCDSDKLMVAIDTDTIYLTPREDMDLVKINIIDGVGKGGNGSSNVDDEVIKDLVEKSHIHRNKIELDLLSDKDGVLAYKGVTVSLQAKQYKSLPKITKENILKV